MASSMIYLGIGFACVAAVLLFLSRGKAAGKQGGNAAAAPAAPEQTLYERLGGAAAITPAVNIFYRKVLADDRIKHFFDGVDMHRQILKQVDFLTLALGGPNKYTGADLKSAHAHLVTKGLNDTHFDAVVENLGATLVELNVPGELIAEAAGIVESVRKDVLSK